MNDPVKRAECERRWHELLPLVSDYVDLHAAHTPEAPALVEHETGEAVTYRRLAQASSAFAAKLLSLGLRRGDIVATSLPFTKEHVFLEYACFQIGVVFAPLDLRLKSAEIIEAFNAISPRAYFFLGETPRADFRPIVAEVMKACPSVGTWVQFQKDPAGTLPGAVAVQSFARDLKWRYVLSIATGRLGRARRQVQKRDPALIIFTTGSTGRPKAAVMCHESILVQNIGLLVGFDMTAADRMLVNLPPSHVGGQTEQLMTTLYGGGTAVLLAVFDPEKSLEAIARHRVTMCGQIPALFNLEWRLPTYSSYDLSSLRFAIYGGQAVDRAFLERLGEMAPAMGTGLGLTETAGFCTYTPPSWRPGDVAGSIGYDSPLAPLTIREPMRADGRAGAEKAKGEVGEICFSGPQLFLGYHGDAAATRRTLSSDGILYTGDLGSYDEHGLHFAGRAKFVIKPKGYQVFPGEVEDFIASSYAGEVAAVGCVGVPHAVFVEAIVAFIELKPGATIDKKALDARLRDLASYKRPSHVVFLPPGGMPYNRVAKIDVMELRRRAEAEIDALRREGRWDVASPLGA